MRGIGLVLDPEWLLIRIRVSSPYPCLRKTAAYVGSFSERSKEVGMEWAKAMSRWLD